MKDHFQYESHSRVKIGTVLLCITFCSVLSFLHRDAAAEECARSQNAAAAINYSVVPTPRHDPVYRIPLPKTYGWQLNAREVQEARRAAAENALQDTAPRSCDYPGIVSPPEPLTKMSDFGKPFAN
jgi:hypothetical protein